MVKYLVETARVDVNLPESNEWGDTPLIEACISVSISVSLYMLRDVSHLDVNITSKRGHTALHWAVSCNKDKGRTKLHLACIADDLTEVMRLLCASESSDYMINLQTNSGYTPLHYACYLGQRDIVKTLMLAGADETLTNIDWERPTQVADRKGHSELLKMLDRATLWEVLRANKLTKLSAGFLMMLTILLIRRKLMMKKWCHILTVIHIALIFRVIDQLPKAKQSK